MKVIGREFASCFTLSSEMHGVCGEKQIKDFKNVALGSGL
jgi:hypothetical protein